MSTHTTCVRRAEHLQEDGGALLDDAGLSGRSSQGGQTELSHCMVGMLLRVFLIVVLIHGL